jgi:Flp pilus assembly protein TadB
MRVVPAFDVPPPRRTPRWPFLVMGLLAAASLATAGAAWRRTSSPTVSIEDAIKLYQTSRNYAEREQALGAIARRARELVRMLRDEEQHGDEKLVEMARAHLATIAKAAAK